MKALTLHQPWASLIAVGAKKIETRDWRPPVTIRPGTRFAIHAGKQVYSEGKGYRPRPCPYPIGCRFEGE